MIRRVPIRLQRPRMTLHGLRRRGLRGLGDAPIVHTFGVSGAFLYIRSDGTYYWSDANGKPISYQPTAYDLATLQNYLNTPITLDPQSATAHQADVTALTAVSGGQAPTAPAPAPAASAPAVNPQGQPVSTQTGQGLRLVNIAAVSGGVYQCTMSDGSQNYCDVDGNPITYTPPSQTVTPAQTCTPQPACLTANPPCVLPTPAAGWCAPVLASTSPAPPPPPPLVIAPPSPTVTPATPPVAVTPSGGTISTTTATPATPVVATPAATTGFDFSSILTWLEGSMIGGIPNWLILGGAALFLFSGSDSPQRTRR